MPPQPGSQADMNLIDVVGLRKYFPIRAGLLKRTVGNVRAVDDISFYIKRGETIGVVGESGCGKTTIGRSIMMLTTPSMGYVFFETPKEIVKDFRRLYDLREPGRSSELSYTEALEMADLINRFLNYPSCRVKEDKKKQICAEARKMRESLLKMKSWKAENERIEQEWTGRKLLLAGAIGVSLATIAWSWWFLLSTGFLIGDPTKWILGGILLLEAAATGSINWLHSRSGVKAHNLLDLADEAIEEVGREYCINFMRKKDVRKMRGRIQFVFQDPFSSLDPRMLIKDIIAEPIRVQMKYWKTGDMEHKREIEGKKAELKREMQKQNGPKLKEEMKRLKAKLKGEALKQHLVDLLEKVGLNVEHMYRYPHEFSGGQRQRIGIARALSIRPDFIVLDEPTSALDVSVQAQILNNLNDLQRDFGLTYMFISHDLSTIRYMCDRVAVMYLGKIVEASPKAGLFAHPTHPYTEALLSVIPAPDPDIRKDRIILAGDVPSPANPPPGCRFHTRCPLAISICSIEEPPLVDYGDEHYVACHVRKEIVK